MMHIKLWLTFCVCSYLFFLATPALSKKYSSGRKATTVIELYTSEGCSSCPPADKWLTHLKTDPGLFKDFIPIAFHVDYWNQLGWKDRFSNKSYSLRQYRHQQEDNISQVYTPGLIVNNKEWRGFLNGKKRWPNSPINVGILKVDHDPHSGQLSVSFTPTATIEDQKLRVNVAILGMNLSTDVKLGENMGHKLRHDFVVLSHTQSNVSIINNQIQGMQIAMPELSDSGQDQKALVVWVSDLKSQKVIQATGGYL